MEENKQVGEFIIRQAHIGEMPIVNGQLSELLSAVLGRLGDIREQTIAGEQGWHAIVSIPWVPKKDQLGPIVRALVLRGYVIVNSWELKKVREVGKDGAIYKSLWAKFSGVGAEAVEQWQTRSVYEAPVVMETEPEVPEIADAMEAVIREKLELPFPVKEEEAVVEQPIPAPAPPRPQTLRPAGAMGADPMAGLVFDSPPDLPPTISKGSEEDNPTVPRGNPKEGPRWG